MFAIYCLKNSRQVDLRIHMLVMDPSVQFFGACEDLPNTNGNVENQENQQKNK
jgi:hypothetical protein